MSFTKVHHGNSSKAWQTSTTRTHLKCCSTARFGVVHDSGYEFGIWDEICINPVALSPVCWVWAVQLPAGCGSKLLLIETQNAPGHFHTCQNDLKLSGYFNSKKGGFPKRPTQDEQLLISKNVCHNFHNAVHWSAVEGGKNWLLWIRYKAVTNSWPPSCCFHLNGSGGGVMRKISFLAIQSSGGFSTDRLELPFLLHLHLYCTDWYLNQTP